ncbi:hypothetical protein V500_02758 [Pseudogymnoascus sp. VKM F-4518 (FW-2643)]|nr:hypothetical protein V500_02758 [Pseudogymnoascus sp. VKM F-4518 (FW-2643)]
MATTSAPRPNPIIYALPAHSSINISCEANAAWLQRITVTIPSDPKSPYQFTGVGEPGDMRLASGADSIELTPAPNERPATFFYEFDATGSRGHFQPALRIVEPYVKTLRWGQFITIASEDGGDQDSNDSIVYINASIVGPLGEEEGGVWQRGDRDGGGGGIGGEEALPRGAKIWRK